MGLKSLINFGITETTCSVGQNRGRMASSAGVGRGAATSSAIPVSAVIASEAKQSRVFSRDGVWIASSHQRKIATQFCRELLAMTGGESSARAAPSFVIASAAKQSRLPPRKDSGLLRCARNDGWKELRPHTACGVRISRGRMIAAAIASRQRPAKACSMVTKPPCS